ncbi:cupin domain-containing protein [Streptomyces sp. NPDC001100]
MAGGTDRPGGALGADEEGTAWLDGSLLQIARVHGVSISELVQEPDQDDFHLVRAHEAMTREGQDGRYTVLSGPRETMSVIRVELAAGKHTKTVRHVGEEWLHVVSGAFTLDISGVSLQLNAGDSVHFDSSKEHRLTSNDDADATVLIASRAATVPMRHPIPASRRNEANTRCVLRGNDGTPILPARGKASPCLRPSR